MSMYITFVCCPPPGDGPLSMAASSVIKVSCACCHDQCLCAGALMPGALVEAHIQHVVSDGLVLSFLTFFTGTVDQFHLAQVRNNP